MGELKRRRFVVLDRDGTVIRERNYLSRPEEVELLPGVVQGLQQLKDLGLGIIMITNQSGIGRGYFDEQSVGAVHKRLLALLEADGLGLDGIYVCPHTAEEGCACRKPCPGLLLR